jgi:dienelactone hydrolase
MGLCAGGHWSFQRAVDRRVAGAVALNPGALSWDPHAYGRRELRRLRRLADPAWWGKLASGRVDVREGRLRAAGAAALAPRRPDSILPSREEVLDELQRQGTPLLLAFSAGEPLAEDLARHGLLARLHQWPVATLEALPGDDHTLRSLAAQAVAHQRIDEGVARARAQDA